MTPRISRPLSSQTRTVPVVSTRAPEAWDRPEITVDDLAFQYADSYRVQFVAGHDAPAVLRELAQNEYDAGGSRLEVSFCEESLRVSGTGAPIDDGGWKRLSVVLGTGTVAGTATRVEEKPNGVGSKNFGLRSLFLYGDRIYVRSAGRQTVLDRIHGNLRAPLPDPAGAGLRGVRIEVPYRTKREGLLQAFTLDREKTVLDGLAAGFAPALTKLALPRGLAGLREVIVRSERCNRVLTWKQVAKHVPVRRKGITSIHRSIRFSDSTVASPTRLEEQEFLRTVVVPPGLRGHKLPAYFTVPGGRVRIGVSVRLRRGGIDLDHHGTWFYPIGVDRGYTGVPVSVNAPFAMDSDRSQVLDPADNSWNKWLFDEAVALVVALVPSDWWQRYGTASYLALRQTTAPSVPYFSEKLRETLRTTACWPTRARKGRGGQYVFARADKMVLPEDDTLYDLLSDNRYLAEAAKLPGILELLRESGAPSFGPNSLVRLRCAGKDRLALATKIPAGAADYHFTDFTGKLSDPATQAKIARALDGIMPRLSNENWRDLKETATTLTEAGALRAASSPLYWVPGTVATACPVPAEDRLHPLLASSTVMRAACEPFNLGRWATEIATKIKANRATAEEREALYRYTLSVHGRAASQLKALLRHTPVLKDHLSTWTVPAEIYRRNAPGAEKFAAVLRFPHPDYAHDAELERAFRFRDSLKASDIIAYARLVEADPSRAADFEQVLNRERRFLTQAVVEVLATIRWLRSSLGGVDAPERLYLDTRRNRACLGDGGAFATGNLGIRLQERLGCNPDPSAEDIISHLRSLRGAGESVAHPEILYPALVAALARDSRSAGVLEHEAILSTGSGWTTPAETLVGSSHARIFGSAVPQVSQMPAAVLAAYRDLGAARQPLLRHWHRLLLWHADMYGRTGAPVPAAARASLRSAYVQVDTAVDGLPSGARFLLARAGTLHSLDDARAARFALDDDPAMATAIADAKIPIALADDMDPRALRFHTAFGVQSLREIRRFVRARPGAEQPLSSPMNVDEAARRLRDPAFAAAVSALIEHRFRKRIGRSARPGTEITRRLRTLRHVIHLSSLDELYRVARRQVAVPVRARYDRDRVYVAGVTSRDQLYGALARVVSELVPGSDGGDLVDGIYRLLVSESPVSMQEYLAERGIPWKPPTGAQQQSLEHQEETALEQALSDLFTESLRKTSAEDSELEVQAKDDPVRQDGKRPPPPLPPLDSVQPAITEADPDWVPPERKAGTSGSRDWLPPTPKDEERDREIGKRGEEIVYRVETGRVRALGFAEDQVKWVARDTPGADHDIRSVDASGQPLWIEVKAKSGTDGRFRWSRAEFELALRTRSRYVLYRVYSADGLHPQVKRFVDPVGILLRHGMRLAVMTLMAELEPSRRPIPEGSW